MKIEIRFSNNRDAFLLSDATEGISVVKPPITFTKGYEAEEIAVSVIVNIAAGIPVSLIAPWLYNKLKNCRSSKISINRREIQISEGAITNIIEEDIKIEQ